MPERSHPVRFQAANITTSEGLLFTNFRAASVAVLTFVTLIDVTSGSSDSVVLEYAAVGAPSAVAFHSGAGGQGNLDRFPLELELAIYPNDQIFWTAAHGSWDVILTGYYTPLVFTG